MESILALYRVFVEKGSIYFVESLESEPKSVHTRKSALFNNSQVRRKVLWKISLNSANRG